MCHDKQMFALIIAIFLSVIFITGWVFTDRNVMDLITATPLSEMNKTAAAPADEPDIPGILPDFADSGACLKDGSCG